MKFFLLLMLVILLLSYLIILNKEVDINRLDFEIKQIKVLLKVLAKLKTIKSLDRTRIDKIFSKIIKVKKEITGICITDLNGQEVYNLNFKFNESFEKILITPIKKKGKVIGIIIVKIDLSTT